MTKIDYAKLVKKDNEAFRKANKARKRVMIARDVLAQLKVKRFLATQGTFANVKGSDHIGATNQEQEVCDVVSGKQCEVCGIGAMFISAVEFADKLKVKDLQYSEDGVAPREVCITENDSFGYLRNFFDEEQLELIETAFERGEGVTDAGYDAINFSNVYDNEFDNEHFVDDPDERLRLIMENIIVHGGTFCPDNKPEVEVTVKFRTPGFRG